MPPKATATKSFVDMDAIIPGFLYRRQITLLAGAPYSGKTTGGLKTLAIPLATGTKDLFGFDRPPLKVLYCSERDWESNCAQLRSVGINELPDNLSFFCVPDITNTADLPKFQSDPLAYIATQKVFTDNPPDVVFLDTATDFHCQSIAKDTNNYAHQRGEMHKFKRWAAKHNVALIAEFHSPKQNDKTKYADHFDKILGSTAILASSTAVAIMERCENGSYVCVYLRSHLAKLDSPRYFRYGDYLEVDQSVATDGDGSITNAELASMLSPLEAESIKYIPITPVPLREFISTLAAAINKSPNHTRNIITNLLKKNWATLLTDPATDEKLIQRNKPQ